MKEQWTAVDNYIQEKLLPADTILESALKTSDAGGLDPIQVSPTQGKFLHLLAKVQGARRILEIGTLGGYSTLWLARALPPGGRLITLEINPKHAEVAQANIERAGLADAVEIRLGPASQTLGRLVSENAAPFDFIFIDADKESYPEYLAWALQLSRPGTVILVDNAVRKGEIADSASTDPRVKGTQGAYDWLAGEPRVSATAIQTVGSKGYDGFILALVLS
jgi:predicted O-methyltransferase YrrM